MEKGKRRKDITRMAWNANGRVELNENAKKLKEALFGSTDRVGPFPGHGKRRPKGFRKGHRMSPLLSGDLKLTPPGMAEDRGD